MNKTLPALPGKAPALPPGAFEIGYTVEATLSAINTLWCQHLAGYTGRDTTRRGRQPEAEADNYSGAIWQAQRTEQRFKPARRKGRLKQMS